MKHIIQIIILAFVLVSCGTNDPQEQDSSRLKVVATTGMVADLAKRIGKDSIEVIALMGPGVDPHLYKATQGDLKNLQTADVILYNGLHLEGKMGEVFEKLGKVKTVFALGDAVADSLLLQDPVYTENFDPHIWFDVSLWARTVGPVARLLAEKAPEHEAYFMRNALEYQAELKVLHDWVKIEMVKIDPDKRILITAHDAFNYFGEAYDVEVRGLQGISTLSEFGLKDRVDLVNYIVDNKIKAVFVETSVSEKNIQAIVEGCQQKGHEVGIGGNLFSDAMGAEDSPEGTYTGMVKANVNTIVNSLQ
jgi:manganese/zinc/iron transport system substrate-binding protein